MKILPVISHYIRIRLVIKKLETKSLEQPPKSFDI